MKMSNQKTSKPNAAEVLDTILHHVALDAAENGRPTEDDKRWSRDLGVQIEARLAELRRKHTPADEPIEKAKPIRPSTLAMLRDALIEAITRITRTMGGAVQYAHRNLKGLSDDDLRRLYDTLDPDNRDAE
jgi:hypothetical protein